jgi:hypothetical protein
MKIPLIVVLAALVPGVGQADESRANFTVSARFVPRLAMRVVSGPDALVVSPEDVSRGYASVSARYRVDSRDPRGYLLRLSPRVGVLSAGEVEIRGLQDDLVLGGAEIEIARPASGEEDVLELAFRVRLPADTVPGTYALPVHVMAASL